MRIGTCRLSVCEVFDKVAETEKESNRDCCKIFSESVLHASESKDVRLMLLLVALEKDIKSASRRSFRAIKMPAQDMPIFMQEHEQFDEI